MEKENKGKKTKDKKRKSKKDEKKHMKENERIGKKICKRKKQTDR